MKKAWAAAQALEVSGASDNDQNSKYSSVLDTAAISFFVRTSTEQDTNTIKGCPVRTASGMFLTRKATTIPIRTKHQSVKAESLIHNEIPHNLLSTTPIITKVGLIVLDLKVAALLQKKWHECIQTKLNYFVTINKHMYIVETKQGAICMGAAADEVSQHDSQNEQQHEQQKQKAKPKKEAEKQTMCTTNKTSSLPKVDKISEPVFNVT